MKKVLFVCLGNICRSPMAEAILKEKQKQAGLIDKIAVSSAATSRWEVGNPPHPGTQKILKKLGIPFNGMVATQITQKDFDVYDLLIGMDAENVAELKKIAPAERSGKIHLFMEVVPGKESEDIPDPYYTGDFEQTYRMINEGTDSWLQQIMEK